MVLVTRNKCVFYLTRQQHVAYLIFTSYYVLLATLAILYDLLHDTIKVTFDAYFIYATCADVVIQLSNYTIVQNEYHTSINQSDHVCQIMLQIFFPKVTPSIPFQSSSPPLTIELELSENISL